jgi:hypothetical protein
LDTLLATHGFAIRSTSLGRDHEDSWQFDNWRVSVHYQGRQFALDYRMGVGHNGRKPGLAEVVAAVLRDAEMGAETFEGWCDELGENTDSRKAERIWQACVAQRAKVVTLLGADLDLYLDGDRQEWREL